MKNDLNTDDITLLIAQARKHRSDATGELIASGSRQLVAEMLRGLIWLADRADRALHVMLMSPVRRRRA
jgi:hypothetical protein